MTIVNLPMVDGFYMEPSGKALLEAFWKKGRHPKKWWLDEPFVYRRLTLNNLNSKRALLPVEPAGKSNSEWSQENVGLRAQILIKRRFDALRALDRLPAQCEATEAH